MFFDDGMTHHRHGAEPLSTRDRHSHLVHGLRKGVIARRSGSRLSTLSGKQTDRQLPPAPLALLLSPAITA